MKNYTIKFKLTGYTFRRIDAEDIEEAYKKAEDLSCKMTHDDVDVVDCVDIDKVKENAFNPTK